METELDNPVIKDDEGAALRELALQVDGVDRPDRDPSVQEPEVHAPVTAEKTVEETDGKPDNSETASVEKPRDKVTGQFVKKTDTSTEEIVTEPAQLSEYEAKKQDRINKEKERQDRSWDNLNRQKAELEQRKMEWEARERQIVEAQKPKPPARKFTAAELYDVSRDFRAEAKKALEISDYDAFNRNDHLAEEAFKNAGQFYQLEQQEAAQMAEQQYKEKWNGHIREAFAAEPDLADANSRLSKEINRLLDQRDAQGVPIGTKLYKIEDGFTFAVEHAKALIKAEAASELEGKVKELQAEVNRLNGTTGLKGGGTTAPPRKESFDDMSMEEMGSAVRQMSREAGLIGTL